MDPVAPPRHVLIYGPPAAGKLTVGRVLAEDTGFRLLHNHLSIDLARHLFDFGAPGFWPLVGDIRLALVTRAAEQGAGFISTYVFSPKENRRFIDAVHEAVAQAGGQTMHVQLRPSPEVLAARVADPERAATSKLADAEELRRAVDKWDLYAPMDPNHLSIDNSTLSPRAVAIKIRTHFGIPSRSG